MQGSGGLPCSHCERLSHSCFYVLTRRGGRPKKSSVYLDVRIPEQPETSSSENRLPEIRRQLDGNFPQLVGFESVVLPPLSSSSDRTYVEPSRPVNLITPSGKSTLAEAQVTQPATASNTNPDPATSNGLSFPVGTQNPLPLSTQLSLCQMQSPQEEPLLQKEAPIKKKVWFHFQK